MRRRATGQYLTISAASERFQAFVPMSTNRQRGRVFSYHRYIENLTAELRS
jgi:hypothetical protein